MQSPNTLRVANRLLLPLCLLFAAGAVLAAVNPAPTSIPGPLESVVVMHVDGSIVFDEQGQVVEYKIDTPVVEALGSMLDRTVHAWRFKPVVIDGTPRRARTQMRIVLAAIKVGESYQVKVDNVVFPGAGATKASDSVPQITRNQLKPPRYPGSLNRAGITGTVLLGIRIGADGQAEQVTAIQSMLFDVKGRDRVLNEAIRQLEKSAVDAAIHWTFNVPATIAHLSAEHRTVTVTAEYVLEKNTRDAPGKWRTVVRIPKREMDWLPKAAGIQKVGVADTQPGEVIPVASAVSLVSDVVGSVVM